MRERRSEKGREGGAAGLVDPPPIFPDRRDQGSVERRKP